MIASEVPNERRGSGSRVLVGVYDRIDPADSSLNWLERQSIEVVREGALRELVYRYSEAEIIAA